MRTAAELGKRLTNYSEDHTMQTVKDVVAAILIKEKRF